MYHFLIGVTWFLPFVYRWIYHCFYHLLYLVKVKKSGITINVIF